MPRASTISKSKARHDPLHVQIDEDETYAKFGRVGSSKRGKKRRDDSGDELDVSKLYGLLQSSSYISV